jgi:AcrR family transcriptional regulator
MRDLSRVSGISLAGLYYYFDSKEKLLYQIQKHTFTTIIDRLRERLTASDDPEERVRIFVHNHVDYALSNQTAMKVLSHEDDVLKDAHGSELSAIKREYYRICSGLVGDLARVDRLERFKQNAPLAHGISTRTAVMGLFGMMNWLYTWHKPRVDPAADEIARQISDIFLRGVYGEKSVARKVSQVGKPGEVSADAHPTKRSRKRV